MDSYWKQRLIRIWPSRSLELAQNQVQIRSLESDAELFKEKAEEAERAKKMVEEKKNQLADAND